jgi:hypothetical protein
MPVADGLAQRASVRDSSPLDKIIALGARRLSAEDIAECSRAFTEGMRARGFTPLDDPDLKLRSDEHETIYNRGNNEKSNFFVFARRMNGRFRVYYSNPSPDLRLRKEEVLVVRDYDGSIPRDEWLKQTLQEMEAASGFKPEKTLYLSTHSHLGSVLIDGGSRGRPVLDEGSSTDKDLIRQLMLYHRDVDASVYHNHFDRQDYADIQAKEQLANILKVPAVEITLPVKPNDTFGPHFLAYFADVETATELDEKMLSTKWGRHSRNISSAGVRLDQMEPPMTFDDALEYFKRMRADGKLALGMAHPAGDRFFGRAGLWNMVSMGKLSLDDLLRIGREHFDAIEMFNTEDIGIRGSIIPLANQDRRFVESALRQSTGRGTLSRDTLCLLTPAIIMNGMHPDAEGNAVKGEGVVKSTLFGDDAHYVPKFKKRPRASLLGCGRTVVELSDGESMGDVSPEFFVKAMREGRMRGEAFWDFGKMGPEIVAARRPGLSLMEVGARVKHNVVGIALAVGREIAYKIRREFHG